MVQSRCARGAPTRPCARHSVLAGLALSLAGCGGDEEHRDAEMCARDPERAARVVTLLGGEPGLGLGRVIEEDAICFQDEPGGWDGSRYFVRRGDEDGEVAASLAHLAHHARSPAALFVGRLRDGQGCAEALDEAVLEEARAHLVELEALARLLPSSRRFVSLDGPSILALEPADREAAMLARIRSHPDGGAGFEPFVRDYSARCERLAR